MHGLTNQSRFEIPQLSQSVAIATELCLYNFNSVLGPSKKKLSLKLKIDGFHP